MWWVLSSFVILGAAWLLWREHGNREAPKGMGSPACERPRRAPRVCAESVASPSAPAVGASPRVGVIPAWRSWRVDAELDANAKFVIRLVSESRLEYWDGPTMQADQEPTMENSSGLYAAKDWDAHIIPGNMRGSHLRVIGRVGLYGKVIEAERGYRASRCVIEELWIVDVAAYVRVMPNKDALLSLPIIAAALAERYQVEVHETAPNLPATIRRDDPITHYLPGPSDDDDEGWDD